MTVFKTEIEEFIVNDCDGNDVEHFLYLEVFHRPATLYSPEELEPINYNVERLSGETFEKLSDEESDLFIQEHWDEIASILDERINQEQYSYYFG